MSQFRLDRDLAKVKRLVNTGGKSAYQLSWEEKKWYFKPQSENAPDQWFGKFWQVFRFECDVPFDVIASDMLEIDWLDYDVKATAEFKGISINRVRCILVRSTNE